MARSLKAAAPDRGRPLLLLSFIILTGVLPIKALPIDKGNDVQLLERGKPIERQLAGGESHIYKLTLAANKFARVVVDQRGVDVVVTLFAPTGEKIAEMDNPNGTMGPEPVSLLSDQAGDYRLQVRTLFTHVPAGVYVVRLEELRTPTPRDETLIAAERAHGQGVLLLTVGTTEARRKAVEEFERALTLWRELGDRRGEASTLEIAARVYADLATAQVGFDYTRQALQLAREVRDRRLEATALFDLAMFYLCWLGEPQIALDYLKQALPLARKVGDRRQESMVLGGIGLIYYYQGVKPRKLLAYYRHAIQLARDAVDRRVEAQNLVSIGIVYEALGENEKALEHYNEGLKAIRSIRDLKVESEIVGHIGLFYNNALKDPRQALHYYAMALPLAHASGAKDGVIRHRIALAHYALGNLTEALSSSEASLQQLESAREGIVRTDLRTSFFASVHDQYEFYISLLMRKHKERPSEGYAAAALHASERARARNMLESLTEARVRRDIDPTLLQRERTLRQALNTKATYQVRLLSGKHTTERAETVKKEIEALTADYQEVQGRIRQLRLRNHELPPTSPLTLKEIQTEVLDDDTLLLEYALGKDRSFLWAVTPTSITSYELPADEKIERVARRVYELLTSRNLHRTGETVEQKLKRVAAADAQYEAAAAELSNMVIGPAASLLGKKRLLVVSDGVLQYIPFSALPKPGTAYSPLGTAHELISLPSASVLALQRRQPAAVKRAPNVVAVLADPVFDPTDERVKAIGKSGRRSARQASPFTTTTARTIMSDLKRATRDVGIVSQSRSLGLRRLPFSRAEADSILKAAGYEHALKALDFRASREVATSAELAQYRIVHFATHGLLNNEHPELSGIILSLIDERALEIDGFLRLNEIYDLKLPAELVVLSACQTALGKAVKGEGLVGLVRGFMYAGAERVVASLWKVDDEATAELMRLFYQRMLQDNMRPAAALRAAKVEMSRQKRWSSPYYWAAFELQGEWR